MNEAAGFPRRQRSEVFLENSAIRAGLVEKLTEHDVILFDILRACLFTGEDVDLPDWQPVFDEMKQQTVAGLPGDWLESHLNADPWMSYCRIQQGKWVRLMYAQDQLLQLLEANDIPCVILKGAAAAMAYPNPTLRLMGDIDFLVKRCDFEKTAALLEANGYSLGREKNPESHHYGYSKNRVTFELHRRLPVIVESDERRLTYFEQGIDAREWHETEGHRFPVFPVTLNGLVLIFHINQHLRTGLGLRQIIDWMMYVHTLPTEKWEELLPLINSTGHDRLARTVTLLCQRYLGLEKIVEEDASLPVEDLLNYILEKGNFGKKAGIDGKIAIVGLFSTRKHGYFSRLQAGGMKRWKAAKKHAILRPFAWMFQAARLLSLLVKNKKSPAQILKHSRHGANQRQMLEKLGLGLERTIPQK